MARTSRKKITEETVRGIAVTGLSYGDLRAAVR